MREGGRWGRGLPFGIVTDRLFRVIVFSLLEDKGTVLWS